jgi:hypothetical protein
MKRVAWASYFDDVDAIIFLCPISCFDERLREDRRINRLEDSYLLWKSVCTSRILAKTEIILFLNKCDLLHNKIKRGMCIKDHIPSYGSRKNDTITVMRCRPQFAHCLRIGHGYTSMLTQSFSSFQTSNNISRKFLNSIPRSHGRVFFISHR